MKSPRLPALLASLVLPAALGAAEAFTSGTVAIGGGGALLDGDRPSFQQAVQHKKDGYGGLEEFRLTRESSESLLRFDARLMPGDDDYLVSVFFDRYEKFYVDAGFRRFRVWYDGSAGRFLPTGTVFTLFDEDLSLTRSKLWLEAGIRTASQTLLKFRYDRSERSGTKSSTHWADSNVVGAPYGTRSVSPTFWDLDEVTQVFSFDVGNSSQPDVKWNVGARYSETELDNSRNVRRRPFETADRFVTSKDQTQTDILAGHGFYLRKFNEKLTLSAGALVTRLDSNLAGSRIYGQSYDPVYDPAYLRRQQRDEGFLDLDGDAELKQTVLNLNSVYTPRPGWTIRPGLRFENRHQESMAHYIETNVGGGPGFVSTSGEAESGHDKSWNEFSGDLEVRHTGRENWTFSGTGEWVRGHGRLEEELVPHTGTPTIDRETENTRTSGKYALKANWYAKSGLTLAVQYYYKTSTNAYDAIRDNTLPGTGNRYPAYITDQDFRTHDFNVRASWRPVPQLNLVTRYDYQRSRIIGTEAGLTEVESSEMTSHILSESLTWSPTSRLFVNASVNLTWDQLATPAYQFVVNSDSNYVNGSVGGGYVLSDKDDLLLDYSFFRARNFVDNSALSLPYGVSQDEQAAYLTWIHKPAEHLAYTVKYGYVTRRDDTWGGLNDFDAHVLYARVQYSF